MTHIQGRHKSALGGRQGGSKTPVHAATQGPWKQTYQQIQHVASKATLWLCSGCRKKKKNYRLQASTAEIWFLTALEAGSPRLRCQQAGCLPGSLRLLAMSSHGVSSVCAAGLSVCLCSHSVSLSTLISSLSKDTSQAGLGLILMASF